MIRKQDFFNIECDHCGAMLDEENWWDDKETCESLLTECNWKKLGDRQYCDECWEYDDDDNIVIEIGGEKVSFKPDEIAKIATYFDFGNS